MRKWELITDLFDNKAGDSFHECPDEHPYFKNLIRLPIEDGWHLVDPERHPKHFRLVEEPEFTQSDMIEAMQEAWNLKPGDDTLPIIKSIRKRKAGR